ncbi:Putative E3 ubiquitin protein ligase [Verticillium dahliae VDG2]|nr:Putative E3 ubiquitin protein ligase [Verticillium dahliae VDG2]
MSSQPNRNGEGSSAGASAERTLDDTMRAPTSTTPDVVVLEHAHNEKKAKDAPNLREDFWLSSSDGRYNSPIIPLRVGQAPDIAIFHVHKDVLLTSEYFRKALCGSFREADAQSMDLPEEDPAIFHFVVAFLYQQTFVPIQAVASVLRSETGGVPLEAVVWRSDDNAGKRGSGNTHSRSTPKHIAQAVDVPGASPQQDRHAGTVVHTDAADGTVISSLHLQARLLMRQTLTALPEEALGAAQGRIHGEDMRTWFQTYALSIEVYICANKFLMNDFKAAIRRRCVDMLETAGGDAATPEVLRLCAALYAGVPESDLLLKMVFARIGFLQPLLWQRTPQETSEFLIGHPDVAALVLREAALRREEDIGGQSLPSMEVAPPLGPPPPPFGGATVVYPYARVHPGPAIWD